MLKIKVCSKEGTILTVAVIVEGKEELTFLLSVDTNTEYYSVVRTEIPGDYKIYERQAREALLRYRGKQMPDEIESMWY